MRTVQFLFLVALAVASITLTIASRAASSVATLGEYQKASCAFDLMQLGKAIHMFADDHGGYICELSGRVSLAANGGEPADNMERLKAAYGPYIADPQVWYCPADPYAHAGMEATKDSESYEYAIHGG